MGWEVAGNNMLWASLPNSSVVVSEGALHLVSVGGTATNGITVATSGDVGIGTTDPKARLHSTVSTIVGADTAAVADGDMGNSEVNIWVDEANDKLKVKVKYSDGTIKSGEIPLT
jgi:hypothetical protein